MQLLILLSLVLVYLGASSVQAACFDPKDPTLTRYYRPSLEDETKAATAIVIGTVSNVQPLSDDPSDPGGWTAFIYTVRVSEHLKGQEPDSFRLRVENDSGGYRMERGESHLLFLAKEGHILSFDVCGNSTQLPKGSAVADRVRALLAPTTGTRSSQPLTRDDDDRQAARGVAVERRR
jgi:hypothetical protein